MATSWGAPCNKKTKTAVLSKRFESQSCWLMHACWPQEPVSMGSHFKKGEAAYPKTTAASPRNGCKLPACLGWSTAPSTSARPNHLIASAGVIMWGH